MGAGRPSPSPAFSGLALAIPREGSGAIMAANDHGMTPRHRGNQVNPMEYQKPLMQTHNLDASTACCGTGGGSCVVQPPCGMGPSAFVSYLIGC